MDINSIMTMEDNKEKSIELVELVNSNVEKTSTLLEQIITPMRQVIKKKFIRNIIKEFKDYFNNMGFIVDEEKISGVGFEYVASYKSFSISVLIYDDSIDKFDIYLYRNNNKKSVFNSIEIICESNFKGDMETLSINKIYDIDELYVMLEQSEKDLLKCRSMLIFENMCLMPKIMVCKRNEKFYFESILQVIDFIE